MRRKPARANLTTQSTAKKPSRVRFQTGGHDRAGPNMEDKMFAVIKTGGKQFRVAANDKITVAKIEGNPGDTVAFGSVLMLTEGEKTTLDTKALSEITVAAEIVEQARGEKVIAFKKRRRQNSKRKRGHRQDFTVVRITEILTGGAKLAQPAPVEAASEPAAAQAAPAPEATAASEAAAPEAAAPKKPRAPRKKKVEDAEPGAE